ncbi:eukaryotic translation initiation factor 3 subunit J-like isoform X2 [Eriocheir sinensis]|uniref:eukaryotic translation initiation factor 3 subunit J-like isoform X2 n=1 Tax=Eriocheir sinensis TaxID=95602 RepID=UPI0021C809E8|nr:eukaryotic translation initiation factor 3 subunit J-like isoform X2 [Eriocheir sinensis]
MSDVSWDDDDFEPVKAAPVLPSDKWDGEDEDDVKDNWDDEDEEKPASTTTTTTGTTATTTTAQAKKKKKKIGDIIAEKEAKQHEEAERRRREAEERAAGQTAAGKLAEKLRLQKVQEDADLQLASELVGTGGGGGGGGEDDPRLLEVVDLNTTEGLSLLRRVVVSKVRATDRLEKRPAFVTFVEDITRDLCQNLEMDEVKRVTAVLNTLYNEKMRASKPKNKKKQTGKAKLNVGSGAIADDYSNDFGAEYEDFI